MLILKLAGTAKNKTIALHHTRERLERSPSLARSIHLPEQDKLMHYVSQFPPNRHRSAN